MVGGKRESCGTENCHRHKATKGTEVPGFLNWRMKAVLAMNYFQTSRGSNYP
ncbi:hypothetical protein BaRGS_00025040, partial [Batillaria attramentaria]